MKKVVVLVTQERLGNVDAADRQFGLEMLDRFLHTLESRAVKPDAICFYTNGVKLVCSGSFVLLSLKLLQGMGVRLLACKSCLEHFNLSSDVAVGEVVGMNDIVEVLMAADSVISA
jgi:hypothetical protein